LLFKNFGVGFAPFKSKTDHAKALRACVCVSFLFSSLLEGVSKIFLFPFKAIFDEETTNSGSRFGAWVPFHPLS